MPPPFRLYEQCVTNPQPLARFLLTLWEQGSRRSGKPPTLREDFSGSGALARSFARAHGHAVAVDMDPSAVGAARTMGKGAARLSVVESDVNRCKVRADIIAATNFPLGYFHTRPALLAYLRHARACLFSRGIFCADLYGGSDCFTPSRATRTLTVPNGDRVRYTWQQVSASRLTYRVSNAIHFQVLPAARAGTRQPPRTYTNAFTYDWRLWSPPELQEALQEVGFSSVEVHDRLGGAVDHLGTLYARPLESAEPLDDPYVIYVVARK